MESLLDRHVLVLNRLWQAVNVCSARRAFTLLYQGHAQVVWRDADNNYLTHDFQSWHDFSQAEPGNEHAGDDGGSLGLRQHGLHVVKACGEHRGVGIGVHTASRVVSAFSV